VAVGELLRRITLELWLNRIIHRVQPVQGRLGHIVAACERVTVGRLAICSLDSEQIDEERRTADPAASLCRECLAELQD
jgi:RNA polymerase-binding transcription factor DksA